ncbi:hypothetical protein [Streptomyces sp. TRM75561]|uniref:hypothetical protein n=1 Tax=Streptomyces sp. TRM75561 TaxID=2975269 RepID=UPI0024472752|nr:hypothetical protein [Streptomyces sp. TRM75561]MDH3038921.1 hypothetical protein [Streptomyces sp. TRM75561]
MISPSKAKAVKLRADRRRQDVDAEGGFVGASVNFEAFVCISGQGSFYCAGADAEAAGGHELVQDGSTDRPGKVDHGVGDDARGLGDLVAGALERDAEAAPVRVRSGCGLGGVGNRDPQDLVGAQQGVDLLGDTGPGLGAQDPAAQHRFLDREVGRLPTSRDTG